MVYRNSILIVVLLWNCSEKQMDNIVCGDWKNYTAKNSGLLTNYVQDIAVDQENTLWITTGNTYGDWTPRSTDGRLISLRNNKWNYYETEMFDHSKFFFNKLFIDSNGEIFLSVNGGNLRQTSWFLSFSISEGWRRYDTDDDSFHYLAFGECDKQVVINSNRFIFSLDTADRYLDTLLVKSSEPLNQEQYYHLIPKYGFTFLDKKNMWFYSYQGVSKYELNLKKLELVSEISFFEASKWSKSRDKGYPDNIWKKNDSTLWVGYDNGIYEIQNDSINNFFTPTNIKLNRILDLRFDKNGTAWLINFHKLISFDGIKWTDHSINGLSHKDYLECLEIDKKNNLWIGTKNRGLFKKNLIDFNNI